MSTSSTVRRAVAVSVLVAAVCVPAAQADTDICVAANGEVRHQSGTATCEANGTGSVALAHGANSSAEAINGDANHSLVHGNDSSAYTGGGDGNVAIVRGDEAYAGSGFGDGN